MENEGVPAEESAEQPGEGSDLAKSVGEGLAKFAEMVNGSPAATDQDREKMAMVMNGFIELVEGNLGQAPGQDAPPPEEPMPSAVPAEGGLRGKPLGPQGRM